MINRLEETLAALRRSGRRGLAPFVTAGDGGLETTLAVLRALEEAGASCVELGVPFSDPIADGPVLQAAADRALAAGTTLDGILAMLQEYRRGSRGAPPGRLPVVLMSYANPLLRRGWEAVCQELAVAGADALIVPDLPVEEGAELRAAAGGAGLGTIFLVAPSSGPERVQRAADASRGFLYVVGRYGVTGAATAFDGATRSFLARVRAATRLPLAVGFGIRDAAGVAAAVADADLAIVGSALVERLHRAAAAAPEDFVGAAVRAAADCLRELRAGLSPVPPPPATEQP